MDGNDNVGWLFAQHGIHMAKDLGLFQEPCTSQTLGFVPQQVSILFDGNGHGLAIRSGSESLHGQAICVGVDPFLISSGHNLTTHCDWKYATVLDIFRLNPRFDVKWSGS